MAKRARWWTVVLMIIVGVVAGSLVPTTRAAADPIPGSDIDPVVLEQRMDRCLEYAVGDGEILAGWFNFSTGEARNWRCSSLRHMLLDDQDRPSQNRHDPYVNIPDFIRCAEKAVRGFPRPGDPGNTNSIYQFGSRQAIMVVNDATGDIATIYTRPVSNDWTACANAL